MHRFGGQVRNMRRLSIANKEVSLEGLKERMGAGLLVWTPHK
jgi:hypothetical protein